MALASLVRTISRSPLTGELLAKLDRNSHLHLEGIARVPKGLIASALAGKQQHSLCVVAATLEEAGRWAAQLQEMGWQTVHFYPTSEASPYEPHYSDEMTWGQMQVLAELATLTSTERQLAIVTTQRALQPHLPPLEVFRADCFHLEVGMALDGKTFDRRLVELGYERVSLVEMEGQWGRRGDIVDVFPVAAEFPVRLELFGDELEKMREFDPTTQRSLDKVTQLLLTPTSFGLMIRSHLPEMEETENLSALLGVAFEKPASIL
ncbi:MAG: transcription-repair coupling factor, partial [Geitlerinemataceae cyanobacterium]